jgi:hypothetical protein
MNAIATLISLASAGFLFSCNQPDSMDLSGEWQYRLDENEVGIKEQWYLQKFSENSVTLPGALRDHQIGTPPSLDTRWTGVITDSSWFFRPEMAKYRDADPPKFPFWLSPVTRYVGKAWFQKEISVPDQWAGQNTELFLERPHWQTRVWVDSFQVGSGNSLSTPHHYILPSEILTPGNHLLTISVDNAIREVDPGINSHSITDHTQGNWNGIVGKIGLQPVHSISVTNIRMTPDLGRHLLLAEIYLSGGHENEALEITLRASGINHDHQVEPVTESYRISEGRVMATLDMGQDMRTWSEFSPSLYSLEVSIKDREKHLMKYTGTFGMREFKARQKHFTINDTTVFLRGTTECCVFPLTGYPPAEEEAWIRIFEKCRAFGLNHMRFHSYCPPEAAFKAADRVGIYLQVEGPSWAKYSVTLGDGKPIDRYLMDETKRIIDTYGNHPSFVMMAYGNEPSGNYVPYLENWVDHFKKYDPQRVFTGASSGRSWAIIENSDYIDRSPPRGLEWDKRQPESEFDYTGKTENQHRPYVTFEMGQWCVYPDFSEIDKYTGSLKARNFELFQEDLGDHHMDSQAREFMMASGKLQASCYKQEIEAALRTKDLAGFQLLSLTDFPGQGTALVGVLDAFWDEKGYITAEEFNQFCNEVVPLVRLPKFTYTNNEILHAEVEVANFSGKDLLHFPNEWRLLTPDDSLMASGPLKCDRIPVGNGNVIGEIHTSLEFVKRARKLKLEIRSGKYTNSWKIWVYPRDQGTIEKNDVHITGELDAATLQILEDGGKVLLLAAGRIENGKEIVQQYTPVFWNTSWFRMRPPHTTGLLIEEKHPVFGSFPTDYFSDLQWWELVNLQQVINLEHFPPDFKPIIQPIDTWFLNRRLAMLFEARVGNGALMVCSMDLNTDGTNGLVSGQFYNSMLSYLNSDAFHPNSKIEIETLAELFEKKERKEWNAYVFAEP